MSSMIIKYRLAKLFWAFLLMLSVFALALHVFFTTNRNSPGSAEFYFKAPPLDRANAKTIQVEKYNEHLVRTRLIQDKVNFIRQYNTRTFATNIYEADPYIEAFHSNFTNIQILYHAPVKWFRNDHEQHISNFNRVYNNTYVLYKDQQEYVNVAFNPKRGYYNLSTNILNQHFREINNLGINVIVWNWQPSMTHETATTIFQLLSDLKMKCTIQIDNYEHRSSKSIQDNIIYFINNFEKYSSWNKYFVISKRKYLALFYIKDAHEIELSDLKETFAYRNSIRGTKHDAIIFGHFSLDAPEQKSILRRSGLDGFYTYSAINGAHFSSTWKNWATCKNFAKAYNLAFVPTVAPGYQDKLKERSGKVKSLRHRSNGEYYGVAFRSAKATNAQFVLINSYNNFVHGKILTTFFCHSNT